MSPNTPSRAATAARPALALAALITALATAGLADARAPRVAAVGPVITTAGFKVDADKEALGRAIFHDRSLSQPAGQSCASCHALSNAFSDPRQGPTSQGATAGLFGPRNGPSLMYAAFTPPLQAAGEGAFSYLGGLFRDGRVDTLEAQAQGPMLNPIEMGNPDAAAVVAKLAAAPYAGRFQAIYGADIFSRTDDAFNAMAEAIATFERGSTFRPFSSKYDAWQRGQTTLTAAEQRGLALFNDPAKANCASCHSGEGNRKSGVNPLFTDFGYDNVGVPRNPANRFYKQAPGVNPDGRQYVDIGLRAVVWRDAARGQFKAPTLRNVAVSGPYMHNGYFRTLRGVVEFYNSRDARPVCPDAFTPEAQALAAGCWPVAEIPETVNHDGMGDLKLTAQEVDDVVTFLGTLTDGWQPPVAKR